MLCLLSPPSGSGPALHLVRKKKEKKKKAASPQCSLSCGTRRGGGSQSDTPGPPRHDRVPLTRFHSESGRNSDGFKKLQTGSEVRGRSRCGVGEDGTSTRLPRLERFPGPKVLTHLVPVKRRRLAAADLLFPQRRSEAAGSGRSLGLNATTQHSPSTWWIEVDWVRLF